MDGVAALAFQVPQVSLMKVACSQGSECIQPLRCHGSWVASTIVRPKYEVVATGWWYRAPAWLWEYLQLPV